MPPRKKPPFPDGTLELSGNFSKGLKTPVPDLTRWLMRSHAVSDLIVWERPSTALAQSTVAKWRDWNTAEQKMLSDAFTRAWTGKLATDATPYPNLINPVSNDHPSTWLDKDIAQMHFMETIACCLMVELSTLKIGWSLLKLSDVQKTFLLDSRSIFEWSESQASQAPGAPNNPPGYVLKAWVLPARPGYMLKTLVNEGILNRLNQKKTIINMIDWCGTLLHFGGSPSTFEFENHWHYRGYSPISRVVQGTVRLPSPSHQVVETEKHRWTAGCFGTTGLMSHLLRIVNIPVETSGVCGHTLPYFSSIDCWLSHGDDPYMLKNHPEISAEQLLVDKPTFDAWFGPEVANACANVGRRSTELLQK